MVTPIDQMMKYHHYAWKDTINGMINYKYKFGDTVRGKHLAEEKMAKVNQIFGDIIKYELGLKPDDAEAKIPTEAHIDPVEYRRKILEKKRISNPAGEPMHIYQDRNQEFCFVNEYKNGGVGLILKN